MDGQDKAVMEKREAKKKKMKNEKKKKRIIISVLSGIVLCIAILFVCFAAIRAAGRSSLRNKAETALPDLTPFMGNEGLTKEEEGRWQEGWIKYQDKIYAYNDEIITFLIMGIDKGAEAKEVAEGTDGGQADALFLTVLDPKAKEVKVIGINRNTMTDVDIYDKEGDFAGTRKAQIAVQHGFGNGMEESCEYQCKAVARLFYNLPIHGYAAINMSAIPAINDAVGGVDVKVLEDLSHKDKALVKDAEVHLMGETAFWYVKYRDADIFGSADMRLERQKQYLNAFIGTAKNAAKNDIGVVFNLYRAIAPMMVTDITLDEVAYLAPSVRDYQFGGGGSIYMLEGETVMGERFEEFYPDEDALYEMILDIFYEQVELR